MTDVVLTIKIMPESPEVNMEDLETKVKSEIKKFINEDSDMKTEIEPVAFGLNALKIIFVMDESIGSPDPLEESIEKFEEVASVEVVDVRRALG
ncbi:elongation factor 1-beta [Candidatus Woesearchaeota archaeon]|jgi:elongation factor 1-beta|nr:elongation factor 1-beta [Candidatus Woesearchaeota archaeon]MBT4321698.1 elongation factor 1-beta [Candidatus Woesearchaeota archaeon]MBT4630718.1 elongation factor 1-beta [Candidatus Woesearchaeota archaeon]